MQIGKQNLAASQHRALGSLRFLHLDDHFGASKYFLRCIDNFSPGIGIFIVRQDRPDAGGFLNNDRVPAMRELGNCGGRQADTKFIRLWFLLARQLTFFVTRNRQLGGLHLTVLAKGCSRWEHDRLGRRTHDTWLQD